MGAYSETMNFYEHLFGDALVSFNKTWNDFTVAATAGASFTKEVTHGTYLNAEGDQYYEVDVTDANGITYKMPYISLISSIGITIMISTIRRIIPRND